MGGPRVLTLEERDGSQERRDAFGALRHVAPRGAATGLGRRIGDVASRAAGGLRQLEQRRHQHRRWRCVRSANRRLEALRSRRRRRSEGQHPEDPCVPGRLHRPGVARAQRRDEERSRGERVPVQDLGCQRRSDEDHVADRDAAQPRLQRHLHVPARRARHEAARAALRSMRAPSSSVAPAARPRRCGWRRTRRSSAHSSARRSPIGSSTTSAARPRCRSSTRTARPRSSRDTYALLAELKKLPGVEVVSDIEAQARSRVRSQRDEYDPPGPS